MTRKSKWYNIVIKIILAIIFSVLIFFPNPIKLFQQIHTYTSPENLVQTDFDGMSEINAEIDSLLPANYTPTDELKAVEKFVYKHIIYRYDWDLWLNADYWPTAEKVWQTGYEDCDGRAVLAASILRARGYKEAKLVGNTQHVWVQTDAGEIMGPYKEKVFEYVEGQAKIKLPSWKMILQSAALSLYIFPLFRTILLIVGIFAIFYFPNKQYTYFLLYCFVAFIGLALLLDWAKYLMFYNLVVVQAKFIIGLILLSAATIGMLFGKHFK